MSVTKVRPSSGSSSGLLVVWDTRLTSKVVVLVGCFCLTVFVGY